MNTETRLRNQAFSICASMGYGSSSYQLRRVRQALLREYDRGYEAGLQMAEQNKVARKNGNAKNPKEK